jgi:hypothetical protein
MTKVLDINTHAFTESGLGDAPFKFTGAVDDGRVTHACDHCFTGIRYLFHIVSADGRHSIVGRDCINKSGDAGLIDIARREKNRVARERAQEKREAQRVANLQAERDRNGGQTDWEIEEEKRQAILKADAIERQGRADRLADVANRLDNGAFGFRFDVATQLREGRLPTDGAIRIVAEILGKQHGRKNSDDFKAEQARVLAIFEKEAK